MHLSHHRALNTNRLFFNNDKMDKGHLGILILYTSVNIMFLLEAARSFFGTVVLMTDVVLPLCSIFSLLL